MRRILAAVAVALSLSCASLPPTYPLRQCRYQRLRDGREVFVRGTVYQVRDIGGTKEALWRSDQDPDDGQHLQWIPAGEVRPCGGPSITQARGGGW